MAGADRPCPSWRRRGNLIDRVTAGYVLDYVDFYFNDWHPKRSMSQTRDHGRRGADDPLFVRRHRVSRLLASFRHGLQPAFCSPPPTCSAVPGDVSTRRAGKPDPTACSTSASRHHHRGAGGAKLLPPSSTSISSALSGRKFVAGALRGVFYGGLIPRAVQSLHVSGSFSRSGHTCDVFAPGIARRRDARSRLPRRLPLRQADQRPWAITSNPAAANGHTARHPAPPTRVHRPVRSS